MHTVDTMGKNISVSPGSTPDMTDNFNCGDYVLWNSGARGQCLFNTAIGIPGQALVCAFRRLDNLKTTRFTMAANLVYHYGKGIKVQGLADTIATLPILSNELRAQITRMIRVTKPARAHVTLGFLMAIPAHLGMGAVATSSHRRGVWISASVTSRADALLGRASVSAARLHSRRATRAALTAWAEARLGWAAVSGARHHTRLATRSALTARLGAVSGPAELAAVQARILTTLTLEVL